MATKKRKTMSPDEPFLSKIGGILTGRTYKSAPRKLKHKKHKAKKTTGTVPRKAYREEVKKSLWPF